MVQLVFVPGIFGTRMRRADGFQLWPPIGQAEAMDADTRAHGLLSDDTTPDGILEAIPILPLVDAPEYGPFLKAVERFADLTLVRFPYDWRRDIGDSASLLAEALQSLTDGEDIILVGHSMGGLVCRMMLENRQWRHQPWFKSVRMFVSVATPHLGAPEAIFRILGLEGLHWIVFPARCFAILASDPARLPAGHQLLPPASRQCVRLPNGTTRNVPDCFPSIAKAGLARTEAMHSVLSKYDRPDGVEYHAAWGYGQMQTTGGAVIDLHGRLAHDWQDGDGTVPAWSAMPAAPHGFFTQNASFRNTHLGILNDVGFLQQLQQWVGSCRGG